MRWFVRIGRQVSAFAVLSERVECAFDSDQHIFSGSAINLRCNDTVVFRRVVFAVASVSHQLEAWHLILRHLGQIIDSYVMIYTFQGRYVRDLYDLTHVGGWKP